VTVRHLLTHTAGVQEWGRSVDLRQDYTEDELLKKAFARSPKPAPGEGWRYSNTGDSVLGILVSRVAGQFYGDVLRERVFGPLGMRTARVTSEADLVPNRAAG
jgi:CubicO group peptidase (beta-lactamase class C family)